MATGAYNAVDLKPAEFKDIAAFVYRVAGIKLQSGKEQLVRSRLQKRLRQLAVSSFSDYLQLVERGPANGEQRTMIDLLTTNKTDFFREERHFEFLRTCVLPPFKSRAGAGRPLRIWSAGCSSGQEPYTIAMVLTEELGNLEHRDVKVLATDISPTALGAARAGNYTEAVVEPIPQPLRRKYLEPVDRPGGRKYRVMDSLRRPIHFARLNLMSDWPMKGPFDVIFCRNVMIYFDKVTQGRLAQRYWELLAPGGHLFIGHSESLNGTEHNYRYVQPAVYQK